MEVKGTEFLLNGKPFYFKGFGRHEDIEVRGKGLDHAMNVKDYNLMKWIKANSFRTSHYPYSEEFMNMADRYGLAVIDETAAVGLNLALRAGGRGQQTFSPDVIGDQALEAHLQGLTELIDRDKNHPSVVMWSLANEPAAHEDATLPYFEKVVAKARELDPSRPICHANVMFAPAGSCKISHLFDVICLNRYYGWYVQSGDLDRAAASLEEELKAWHAL